MQEIEDDFLDSLDLDDSEIVPFIPEILKDLWELGSMPDYVIELVEKYIPANSLNRVIDLGCGKGAVLIRLSENITFAGIGIDLMPEFIEEARSYAAKWSYSKELQFEVGDIKEIVEKGGGFDLVIYGHDSDIFGNVMESLLELGNCVSDQGWIVFEGVYSLNSEHNPEGFPTESELFAQIEKSRMEIVGQIVWDREKLKQINQSNTASIREQINRLVNSHPDKKEMFHAYLKNQIEECRELENNLACLTILLKKKILANNE